MKNSTYAFIIALGLVVPGIASAANLADSGNAIYERDLAFWNGAPAVSPAANENAIYARDLAFWNAAPYVKRIHGQYDSIYAHDLADANGTGLKVKPVIFTYDAIKARDLAEAEAQHAYGAV
ncbi:MAG: hypothetical protein K9M17_03695 [Mariprofundaceae bacterium]|nr:hypothetical protein [Mariprofundaceae bacterium]